MQCLSVVMCSVAGDKTRILLAQVFFGMLQAVSQRLSYFLSFTLVCLCLPALCLDLTRDLHATLI